MSEEDDDIGQRLNRKLIEDYCYQTHQQTVIDLIARGVLDANTPTTNGSVIDWKAIDDKLRKHDE